MNRKFKKILEELYALDNSLRDHEEELILILRELVRHKPDTKFDPAFAEKLREDIHRRIGERASKSVPQGDGEKSPFSFSITYMQAAGLVTAGAVLGVLPFSFPYSGHDYIRERAPERPNTSISFESDVIPVGDNAFGEINLEVSSQTGQAAGLGGGGGDAENSEMKIMPVPYEPVRYEYVFDGELELPESGQLPVYKRVTHENAGQALADLLDGFDLGLFDLNRFSGLEVQSISLVQEREFGYTLYIDFTNETVSISTNYNQWPNPMNKCWEGEKTPEESEKCVQRNMLKPSDVPADSKLISIARDFLNEYGIDASGYGQPYVNHDWKIYYEQTLRQQEAATVEDSMIAPAPWVPDQLQVVFPYSFDDQMVYDSSGNPTGLNVSVDIRNMKASGVYNLTTGRYEKSSYDVETDEAEILELVKNGGLWPMWYGPEAAEVKEVSLAEPKRGFVQHWSYRDGQSHELFVPALVFPVEDEPATGEYLPRAIIVPLVQDAIEIPEFPPMMPLERMIEEEASKEAQVEMLEEPARLENSLQN